MSNFLLQRHKTFYYRRRIPKELLKYFKNREEIRIKVSQSSHFQATILNSLFKELITMLELDALNEKDAESNSAVDNVRNHLNEVRP